MQSISYPFKTHPLSTLQIDDIVLCREPDNENTLNIVNIGKVHEIFSEKQEVIVKFNSDIHPLVRYAFSDIARLTNKNS